MAQDSLHLIDGQSILNQSRRMSMPKRVNCAVMKTGPVERLPPGVAGMVARTTLFVREYELRCGLLGAPVQDLNYALGHKDDAFVANFGTPKAYRALLKSDLSPLQSPNFTATCAGI